MSSHLAGMARELVAAHREQQAAHAAFVAAGEDIDAAGGWGVTSERKAPLRDAYRQARGIWKAADERHRAAWDTLVAAVDAEQEGMVAAQVEYASAVAGVAAAAGSPKRAGKLLAVERARRAHDALGGES